MSSVTLLNCKEYVVFKFLRLAVDMADWKSAPKKEAIARGGWQQQWNRQVGFAAYAACIVYLELVVRTLLRFCSIYTVCVHSVLCPSIEVQASSSRLVRCPGLFEVLECYWCMRMMSRYFDYLFYVDFEASMADQRAQNALGHLQVYYGTYFPRNSISSCTYLWNHVVELVMWYFLFRSNVHLVSVYITTLFTSNMFLSNHLTLHRD